MSALKEQLHLLGQFLRTDFRKILLGCTLAMAGSVFFGLILGYVSPEVINTVLEQFMAMVEEAGIMDSARLVQHRGGRSFPSGSSEGGTAMTELEKYQAFHQHIRQRKAEIPAELEALRQAGKSKTVQFRELLAEKLTVEMILTQLRYAGLEE